MSEHSRIHDGRSYPVRDDRYPDDRSYHETQDEYERNRRAAYDEYPVDQPDVSRDDHFATPHEESVTAETFDDYTGNQRIDPAFAEPEAFAETEEVWMKEKLNRISYSDIDLQDVGQTKHSNVGRTVAGFAGIAGMLALIGFLALSSKPDLSPEEIIAMEGYGGEQKTKTLFNLAGLRNCEDGTDCGYTGGTQTNPVTAASGESASRPEIQTNTVSGITEAVSERFITVQEIPATNTTVNQVNFAANGETDTGNNDLSRFQEVDLIVQQQWSNVRRSPDINSGILTSLAEGTSVTMIAESGQWFEVEVSGRQRVRGYMHRSTLSRQ